MAEVFTPLESVFMAAQHEHCSVILAFSGVFSVDLSSFLPGTPTSAMTYKDEVSANSFVKL